MRKLKQLEIECQLSCQLPEPDYALQLCNENLVISHLYPQKMEEA